MSISKPISKPISIGVLAAMVLAFAGCEDEEKQAEIDELSEELVSVRKSSESRLERYEAEREVSKNLKAENTALKSQVRSLERRAEDAERDLKRIKEREEKAKLAEKEREPTSREKLDAAKKIAEGQLPSIVTIAGDGTNGTGMLVAADGKNWIYLAASTIVGNSRIEITTSDETRLEKFGVFELSADAGIARLEVKDEVEMSLVPATGLKFERGTMVLGVGDSNALLDARVYESTSESLDVGSRFSTATVGSPVFSGETGELMGVIVTSTDAKRDVWTTSDTERKVLAVCRLDRSLKWSSVPIATFMEEARVLAEADRFTQLVYAFAATSPSGSGIGVNGRLGGSASAREILEENGKMSSVSELFKVDEWLKEKGERASKADIERRISGVYGGIGRISLGRTKKLEARKFSPYHAKVAAQSLEWRRDAEKELSATAESFK